MSNERKLEQEATNLLRQAGYRADGRPIESVEPEQDLLEFWVDGWLTLNKTAA